MAEEYTSERDITFGDLQSAPSVNELAAQTSNVGGMNVDTYASQLVGDPSAFFTNEMKLANNVPTIDANATGTNIDASASKYNMNIGGLATTAQTAQVSTAQAPTQQKTATYTAAQTQDAVKDAQMTAATGSVRPEAVVQAAQADIKGLATGTNADGTKNYTGEALGAVATQNISTVIDTSTVSGKLLAQTLGEGNYLDSKATIKGQLDILSKEFVDPQGNPKIPTWAAGVARNISRIAAFKGMTGTAATAAVSQAIMEATLPIAQQEAQFFQTTTLKNLDNKQQQTINTANVLSKMELANMDTRMQAAVENAKNFMQMDLTNLSNTQQASIINTQSRVQSILEDAKSENTARMFTAQSENEMNRFYDNLRSNIATFNSAQVNNMNQFNSGQINSTSQFNATMENTRETFYRSMQYNIDIANAKWRQNVTSANAEMVFQAYATDVKNMVGMSTEALNQLWDRADSLLDKAWKTTENNKALEVQIATTKAQQQLERDKIAAESEGGFLSAVGSVVGSVGGAVAGKFAGAYASSLWPVAAAA